MKGTDTRSIATIVLIAVGVCVLAYMAFGMFVPGVWGGMRMQMEESASEGALPAGTFDSHHVGLHFDYPAGYSQALNHINEGAPDEYHQVVFATGSTTIEAAEGEPAITIAGIDVDAGTNLEAWVKSDKRSNYQLATDTTLTKTTVGGEPALAFTYSGLYENDAIVVKHKERMYVFNVSWMGAQDQIRKDFDGIIKDVSFIDD